MNTVLFNPCKQISLKIFTYIKTDCKTGFFSYILQAAQSHNAQNIHFPGISDNAYLRIYFFVLAFLRGAHPRK